MNALKPGKYQRHNLIGYWLQGAYGTHQSDVKSRLDDICHRYQHRLVDLEIESGNSDNPVRIGLWAALRKLVCYKCPTKRMSFNILNIDDFVWQALAPCTCGHAEGLDGIVINGVKHLSSDPVKGSQLAILLACAGKHVINEDGICISCCHPATKSLVEKRYALIAPKAC